MKKRRLSPAGTRVYSFLWWLGVTALCRTLSFRVHDPGGWVHGHHSHDKKIWVCWHGQQMVAFYFFRHRGTGILSSLHRDGDLSSDILRRFNWHIVRGSSTRGGARGLLELLRYLRGGAENRHHPRWTQRTSLSYRAWCALHGGQDRRPNHPLRRGGPAKLECAELGPVPRAVAFCSLRGLLWRCIPRRGSDRHEHPGPSGGSDGSDPSSQPGG